MEKPQKRLKEIKKLLKAYFLLAIFIIEKTEFLNLKRSSKLYKLKKKWDGAMI